MRKFLPFIVIEAIAAVIAWAGGYDFDTRGPHVALFMGISIIFGVVFTPVVLFITEHSEEES